MTILELGWSSEGEPRAQGELGKQLWVGDWWVITGGVAAILLVSFLCAMAG